MGDVMLHPHSLQGIPPPPKAVCCHILCVLPQQPPSCTQPHPNPLRQMGSFTPEGTLAAAMEKLPHMASLGFTAVQLMPMAEHSDAWGYNPRQLLSIHGAYGTPDVSAACWGGHVWVGEGHGCVLACTAWRAGSWVSACMQAEHFNAWGYDPGQLLSVHGACGTPYMRACEGLLMLCV